MRVKNKLSIIAITALLTATIGCKKDSSLPAEIESTPETLYASTFAVGRSGVTGDSIYVINACEKGAKRVDISFSSLPAAASSYLSANYAGYNAQKAFAIKDSAGNVTGYIAVVHFNGKPVAIKFDASGNFIKVLEQREGPDVHHPGGWHPGGCFDNRDGKHRDSVSLAALPATIKGYFATNYAQDTLVRAFKGKDGSIVVISINNGIFATVFDANGAFVKRQQLPARPGRPMPVDAAALPTNVQSYLTTTYPNYVFKHAFKIMVAGSVKGYVVFIDANNTKYAVEFDEAGNFIKAITVR